LAVEVSDGMFLLRNGLLRRPFLILNSYACCAQEKTRGVHRILFWGRSATQLLAFRWLFNREPCDPRRLSLMTCALFETWYSLMLEKGKEVVVARKMRRHWCSPNLLIILAFL